MRNTQHKALCYVVFSTPLLPHPSWAQISSSAPYSRKPSAYIPSSMWATKFHTHTKNRQNYRHKLALIYKWLCKSLVDCIFVSLQEGKAVPVQAQTGPEGPRNFRLSGFSDSRHKRGRTVSHRHRPLLPLRKNTRWSFWLEGESTPLP